MQKELDEKQKAFIVEYLRTNNATQAYMQVYYGKIYGPDTEEFRKADSNARYLLKLSRTQAEIERIRQPLEITGVSSAGEVMRFFSSVMRGEVKDQFGLEAPLSERLKAANELAKRTIDIENRAKGISDAKVEVVLNWDRD